MRGGGLAKPRLTARSIFPTSDLSQVVKLTTLDRDAIVYDSRTGRFYEKEIEVNTSLTEWAPPRGPVGSKTRYSKAKCPRLVFT